MNKLELDFRGNKILCWMKNQPQDAVVAIRPLCEAIGILPHKQIERLERDSKFSCTHMGSTGADGKCYEMTCLPISQLALWLCSINSNKVKAEVRQSLLEFQQFCQMELWAAINGTAGIDRVKELEDRVHFLENMNRQFLEAIKALTDEVRMLRNPVEHILNREASHAGSRLAAQRKVNKFLQ